jgi:rod shape-determining protein MreC
VTNRQSGSWWRTITIDKGARDGVLENSPIMTPVAVDSTDSVEGALVGKVTVVGEESSMVVLATDEECNVAAYVHGVFAESSAGLQRVQGILTGAPGAGTTVPHLVLRNLPKEADRFGVKAGAKVYSAGSGGVFPPGLILGYIKEFEVKDIDAEARVTTAIDFNSLSHVFVLLESSDRKAPRADVVPAAEPVAEPDAPAVEEGSAPPVAEPAPRAEPEVPRARPVGDEFD